MTLESLKAKLLSNPETKKYYKEVKLEFDIAKEILKLRTKLGLTQRELAEKVGIKQPQLARIESGKQLARLDTLQIIANECGYSVEIRLVPKIHNELIDRTIDAIIEENEREQTAEEYKEELKSDEFFIKEELMSLKISNSGKTLELDTETFYFLEEEEDEEVTDDDKFWDMARR